MQIKLSSTQRKTARLVPPTLGRIRPRRFPGAYAMVARVLTHRALETTINNYSYLDGEISMQAYQELVMDVKSGRSPDKRPRGEAVAYFESEKEFRHVSK